MSTSPAVVTKPRLRPPGGFTLIEVLFTLSIISAFVAMMFPTFQPPREADAQLVTPVRYVAANTATPACTPFTIAAPAPFTSASALCFDEQWTKI